MQTIQWKYVHCALQLDVLYDVYTTLYTMWWDKSEFDLKSVQFRCAFIEWWMMRRRRTNAREKNTIETGCVRVRMTVNVIHKIEVHFMKYDCMVYEERPLSQINFDDQWIIEYFLRIFTMLSLAEPADLHKPFDKWIWSDDELLPWAVTYAIWNTRKTILALHNHIFSFRLTEWIFIVCYLNDASAQTWDRPQIRYSSVRKVRVQTLKLYYKIQTSTIQRIPVPATGNRSCVVFSIV